MQHIFFSDFSGWNNVYLKIFCIIKTYCGVVYPPKIFFIKLTKSHISSLIVRIFFELVWLWTILLLYVKQLNGSLIPHFRRWFLPPKNHFGHVKKNTCRLVFRVLQHMCQCTKSERDTYLGFLASCVCWHLPNPRSEAVLYAASTWMSVPHSFFLYFLLYICTFIISVVKEILISPFYFFFALFGLGSQDLYIYIIYLYKVVEVP